VNKEARKIILAWHSYWDGIAMLPGIKQGHKRKISSGLFTSNVLYMIINHIVIHVVSLKWWYCRFVGSFLFLEHTRELHELFHNKKRV
jgi:hypothetical protein